MPRALVLRPGSRLAAPLLLTCLLLALLVGRATATEQPRDTSVYAIPPGQESRVMALFGENGASGELAPGWSFAGLRIERFAVRVMLSHQGGMSSVLLHGPEAPQGQPLCPGFRAEVVSGAVPPEVLTALGERIAATAPADWWEPYSKSQTRQVTSRASSLRDRIEMGLCALALLLTLLLFVANIPLLFRIHRELYQSKIGGPGWSVPPFLLMILGMAAWMRWEYPPHTFLHTNSHGYFLVRDLIGSATGIFRGNPGLYGWGTTVLFRPLFLVLPTTPEVVFTANLVLGCVTCVVLVFLAHLLLRAPLAAEMVGAFAATFPLWVRLSPTESPSVLKLLGMLFVLWVALAWREHNGRPGSWRLWALLVVSLAYVVQLRVLIASFPLVIGLAWLWLGLPEAPGRPGKSVLSSGGFWAGVLAFAALAGHHYVKLYTLAMTSPPSGLHPEKSLRYFFSKYNLLFNPDYTAPWIAIFAGLGLLVLLWTRFRLAGFLLSAGLLQVVLYLSNMSSYPAMVWCQSLWLWVALILVGAAFLPVVDDLPGPIFCLLIGVFAGGVCFQQIPWCKDFLTVEGNPQREYRLLREMLPGLPDEAAVILPLVKSRDTIVEFPDYLVASMGKKWHYYTVEELFGPLRREIFSHQKVLFYQGLACHTFEADELRTAMADLPVDLEKLPQFPDPLRPQRSVPKPGTCDTCLLPECRHVEQYFLLRPIASEQRFANRPFDPRYLPQAEIRLSFQEVLER